MKADRRRKPFAWLSWSEQQAESNSPAKLTRVAEVFPSGSHGRRRKTDNFLVLGENLAVMAAFLAEHARGIDLIYADPPFLSGKAYAARVGRGEDSRRPASWRTVQGYRDIWRDGAEYLDMLHPRLLLMHQLLSPTGTLYLHLDWHAAAYARVMLDEIFGPDRLLNEIAWVYHGPSPIGRAFKRKHDTILVYAKSSKYTFNADAVRIPYDASTLRTFASSPKAGFGKLPDLERGKVPEDWWYFPVVARLHRQRTGFPTQKPEALLERIILASSNPGDRVADFFCGSGTTAVVADKLDRRWITCDRLPLAVNVTHRRLLLQPATHAYMLLDGGGFPGVKPGRARVSVVVQGRTTTASLTGVDEADSLRFPDDIACWEVDWAYDGGIFRSRSHEARGWQEGSLPLRLTWKYASRGSRTIAVQVTDASGRVWFTTRQVEIR